MNAAGHEACDVSHIHQQISTHGVGRLPEFGEVNDPGIGGGTGDNELGAVLLRQRKELVVVNGLGFVVQTVGNDVEELAGNVHRAAVGEMAAVGQAHDGEGGPDRRPASRRDDAEG